MGRAAQAPRLRLKPINPSAVRICGSRDGPISKPSVRPAAAVSDCNCATVRCGMAWNCAVSRACIPPHRNEAVRYRLYGAVEKTRTSTGYSPTTTSTLRVYQFRHDRTQSASGANPPRAAPAGRWAPLAARPVARKHLCRYNRQVSGVPSQYRQKPPISVRRSPLR